MFSRIHVPVDNSDHSGASVDLAVALGASYSAEVVGSHVYAAALHDVRFKQMEFTLPDEYKEEEELEKQRKIHDALIARGLHLISDSYLDQMQVACDERGVAFERKHFDGRNFEAIVNDVNEDSYDLLILGALGMGAVKNSDLGSVCERVLRRTTVDTLVVRDPEVRRPDVEGDLLVGLDGSFRSHGALAAACDLAERFGKTVHVVAVSEPGRGDRELLEAHLTLATELGRRQGVTVETSLREGAARDELMAAAEELSPWAVILGRSGIDAADAEPLGSTAEQVLREGRWNVLLTGRSVEPAAALADEDAA
ncbi:MAG: universal stress protein [Acidobacteriota bacterium]